MLPWWSRPTLLEGFAARKFAIALPRLARIRVDSDVLVCDITYYILSFIGVSGRIGQSVSPEIGVLSWGWVEIMSEWTIYGEKLDLEAFKSYHPGGELTLLLGEGRDCTRLFEQFFEVLMSLQQVPNV